MSRYGIRGVYIIMQGALIAFVLPVALNPIIFPIAMIAGAVMIGFTLANYQKRI